MTNMKHMKNLLSWGVTPATAKRQNEFRRVLVEFDQCHSDLPNVLRLAELRLAQQMTLPEQRQQGEPTPYELLTLTLLLPTEKCQLSMTVYQRVTISLFLEDELDRLLRHKQSPFHDVGACTLHRNLRAVRDVVEDYVTIVPLFRPCFSFVTSPSFSGVFGAFSLCLAALFAGCSPRVENALDLEML